MDRWIRGWTDGQISAMTREKFILIFKLSRNRHWVLIKLVNLFLLSVSVCVAPEKLPAQLFSVTLCRYAMVSEGAWIWKRHATLVELISISE